MFFSESKKLLAALFFTTLCATAFVSTVVFAQDKSPADIINDASLAETIDSNGQRESQLTEQIFKNAGTVFEETAAKQTENLIARKQVEMRLRNKPSFIDPIMKALTEDRVISVNIADETKKLLDDTTRFLFLAHQQIENIDEKSDDNPYATTYIEMEAGLLETFNKMFCVPESLNASEDCKAQKNIKPPYENFIDFFTAERTWPDEKITSVLLMARRFFGGASDKIFIGQGVSDPGNFISNQGGIAKANLRMSILNDLAAWRAPTSKLSGEVGGVLLEMLAPTDQIPSLDYDALCAADISAFPLLVNVCSMSAVQVQNGKKERVISQAAIDRIVQFNYMMSKDFYDQVTNPLNMPDGPVKKVGVYLKAQQIAQDYRALRLLQMKVAATAMNMLNEK